MASAAPPDVRDDRKLAAPADGLLHPVALLAVIVLLLNDHVWKAASPGWATGKLSDFAGLTFFPLVLVGTFEIVLFAAGRWNGPSHRAAILASAATAAAFTMVKLTDVGSTAWSFATALAGWAPTTMLGLFDGGQLQPLHGTLVVRDATDLIALPFVMIGLWIAVDRAASRRGPGDSTLSP